MGELRFVSLLRKFILRRKSEGGVDETAAAAWEAGSWKLGADLKGLEEIGRQGAALLEREERWIHRRVDSVVVGPDLIFRRRLSIDLTLPAELYEVTIDGGAAQCYLPVSYIGKWPPLLSLDIRDESGTSLPLLTLADNRVIDAGTLLELARRTLGQEEVPERVAASLREIAAAPPPDAADALRRFVSDSGITDQNARRILLENPLFMDVAQSLVTNTLLWLPFAPEPRRRRIVKLAYEVGGKGQLVLWRSVLTQLGWFSGVHYISTPHLGGEGSYHLDITAWPDSEIVEAGLVVEARTPVPRTPRAGLDPKRVHEAKNAHVQVAGKRAHLYLTGARMGSLSLAWASVRLQRRGFLTASFASAATIATLLWAFRLWPDRVFDHDPAGPVAVLLIAPAVLAAFLARPVGSDHASSVLRGVRALVGASGAVAVLSAFSLIAWSPTATKQVWLVAASVAAVIAVMLFASLVLPRRRRQRGR